MRRRSRSHQNDRTPLPYLAARHIDHRGATRRLTRTYLKVAPRPRGRFEVAGRLRAMWRVGRAHCRGPAVRSRFRCNCKRAKRDKGGVPRPQISAGRSCGHASARAAGAKWRHDQGTWSRSLYHQLMTAVSSGLVAPMVDTRFFTFYKRVSLKPPTRSPCVPTAGAGRPDIGLDGPGRRSAGPGL